MEAPTRATVRSVSPGIDPAAEGGDAIIGLAVIRTSLAAPLRRMPSRHAFVGFQPVDSRPPVLGRRDGLVTDPFDHIGGVHESCGRSVWIDPRDDDAGRGRGGSGKRRRQRLHVDAEAASRGRPFARQTIGDGEHGVRRHDRTPAFALDRQPGERAVHREEERAGDHIRRRRHGPDRTAPRGARRR